MAAALHGLADLTPLTFSQLRLKLGAWHFCCVAEKASFKALTISFCWKLSDFRNSRGRFSCTKLATSCPKGPWPSKTPTSWHMKSQGLTPRTSANMTKYDKIWQIYLNISEHSLPAKEVKSRWMRPWMTKVLKWQDLCEKRKVILTRAFWFQALSANAASVETLFGQATKATDAPWPPIQDLRPAGFWLPMETSYWYWSFGYLLIEFWGWKVNYKLYVYIYIYLSI